MEARRWDRKKGGKGIWKNLSKEGWKPVPVRLPDAPIAEVPKEEVAMLGPFECPGCGGQMRIEAAYLERVSRRVICPYCGGDCQVPIRTV